jgi:hypothetical protein
MTDKLSLPPIKAVNSYLSLQQKRQRGSWWDPQTDKTTQIQKVKDMVRLSSHSRGLSPSIHIAPAAEFYKEKPSTRAEPDSDSDSSFSNRSSNIIDKPAYRTPIPPKIRKKSQSDTPRLQYVKAAASNQSSSGTQTESKSMPAETQTDYDKASVESLKESIEKYRKVISKHDAYFKRLERLSLVILHV